MIHEGVASEAFELGRTAWPGIELSLGLFREHLTHALGAGEIGHDWLRHSADLYLCCGCAHGNPQSLRALEDVALPHVVKAISRLDARQDFVDEVLQTLRQKLLVGEKAKIADYAGRGTLSAWLSVVATRIALDALRARKVRGYPRADLPDKLAQVTDESPLSGIIRSRYRDSFQHALRAAVDELPSRDRNLLRLQLLGGCSIDQLAKMYLVHRATAARWLESARTRVFDFVRDRMKQEHCLTDGEFNSIARGVRSQLDLSISARLSDLQLPGVSNETDGLPRTRDCEPD